MKHFTAFILVLFSATIYGQAIDSIKYENGYLYYRSYGKGETIILLSGGPGNYALQIEPVAKTLSTNYRVLLLEQRGTGLSIPTPFDSTTINQQAAFSDINLLLSKLKIGKAIFCGHSYGASLAMIYTSKFPGKVKSLILIAPGYFGLGWPMYRITADNLYSRLGKSEIERADSLSSKAANGNTTPGENTELSKIWRLPYIYNKTKIDSLFPLLNGRNNAATFNYLLTDMMKYEFDVSKDLSAYKGAIHLICGRQDFLTYIAYELKIANPRIQLHWIEKSGHFPMYEQPVDFYKILFGILHEQQ